MYCRIKFNPHYIHIFQILPILAPRNCKIDNLLTYFIHGLRPFYFRNSEKDCAEGMESSLDVTVC
jgi:hypothetical protein